MLKTNLIGSHLSTSPSKTRKIAGLLAIHLKPGDTIVLVGRLGAGKTEFVRGVAEAFGVDEGVASPSFVRVHSYGGEPPLYHADFYLARSEEDAADYGLDELASAGAVVMVEWGDRFTGLLPANSWQVNITLDPSSKNRRQIEISRTKP